MLIVICAGCINLLNLYRGNSQAIHQNQVSKPKAEMTPGKILKLQTLFSDKLLSDLLHTINIIPTLIIIFIFPKDINKSKNLLPGFLPKST